MIQRLDVEYRESAGNDLTNILRHIVEAGGSLDAALGFVLRIEIADRVSAMPLGAVARATTSCRD